MEHTAPTDEPFVGVDLIDAQSKVFLQLVLQTVVDVAAGAELPFFTEERTIVDGEQQTWWVRR